MPMPAHTTRHRLVLWLQTITLAHLLGGLLLSWAGSTALFDGYLLSVEQAFWGQAAPTAGHSQQVWWMALFGATLQGYALYMLALIRLADHYRSSAAWGWLMAGLLLWAPQDIAISLQAGMWSHLAVDSLALLVLLPPLFWLYRHDRRASTV
ncbi:cell division protein [Pseudomonas xanthosomatis]|uniref:cell division protein n=1 Tax=Pseudomonas xanthosomatis TaxID=2842356 RepID=UPI001C3D7573|nr:cell division protein [Pseudomonas xanthosomatis]QXH48947.1 cell division protein [Pseudomonas xanthosomatis]